MENQTSFWASLSLITGIIWLFLAIAIPFFIFRIRNELIKQTKTLNEILAILLLQIAPDRKAFIPQHEGVIYSEQERRSIMEGETVIYREPKEDSTILSYAPQSWKMSYGPEDSGWTPVEIIADAPMSKIGMKGWIKTTL
jgi:hypothetical protein